MAPRTRWLLAAAFFLMGIGACGGGGGGDDAATRNNATFEKFVADLSQSMCDWQFRCCSLPEIDLIGRSGYLTEAECGAAMAIAIEARLSEMRFAINEGRMMFDLNAAAACIEEFAAGACSVVTSAGDPLSSPLWDKFNRCPSPAVGKLSAGSVCFSRGDCRPGTSCRSGADLLPTSGVAGPGLRAAPTIGDRLAAAAGHCRADSAEGESCATTSQCGTGLYCRGTDLVCARPASEGQPCVQPLDATGTPIATIVACDERSGTLLCIAGTCSHLPRDGEPCLPQTFNWPSCDPAPELDLACVGRDFNGAGFCKKAVGRGAVCSGGGGLPGCAAALACALSSDGLLGTCEPAPAAGAPCAPDGRCGAPAVCYAGSFTCVLPPLVHEGAPCGSDLDCASLRCLPALGSAARNGPSGLCLPVALPAECSGAGRFVVPAGNPPGPGATNGGG